MKKLTLILLVAFFVAVFGISFLAGTTQAAKCSGCYYTCNLQTGQQFICCYTNGCKANCTWTGLYCA